MGDWRLEITEKALKDLEDVPAKDRDRIKARMERLASQGPADLKKLRGGSSEWRVRVGKWRARFERDNKEHVIRVLRVLPRRDAYR